MCLSFLAQKPTKIVLVGLNYKDHAKELGMPLPQEPILFMKPVTALIGPEESIIYPAQAKRVDYEAELAIIIKDVCKEIEPEVVREHNLKIQSFLNGELRQDSNTANFIFTVSELVSFISHVMTLMPGDIIATGTPGGIGAMNKGDTIEIRIAGIGALRNYVE